MRFIRKNGKIIPIKESTNQKIDFVKGIANGALARHIINKPSGARKAFIGFNIADTGLDVFTAINRFKASKSVGEFAKKELKGWGIELAGNAIGFGASHALIAWARKYKASRVIKGLLK